MKALNLLHLSDFHICEQDQDYLQSVHGLVSFLFGGPSLITERSLLRRAVEARSHSADWLLVTGDVTHTGRRSDLDQAVGFIQDVEREVIASHMGLMALIPGNHDRYKAGWPYPGNVGPFEVTFGKYWSVGQGVQFKTLSDELRVQMGFADFTLREAEIGQLQKVEFTDPRSSAEEIRKWTAMWGQGCVYKDTLAELTRESECRIGDGWHVIWAIHFAPFPRRLNSWQQKALRLRNEESLVAAAKGLGVTHIFCGHTHKEDHYFSKGVEVFCAGPSLQASPSARASFFEVQLSLVDNSVRTGRWETVSRLRGEGGYGVERKKV